MQRRLRQQGFDFARVVFGNRADPGAGSDLEPAGLGKRRDLGGFGRTVGSDAFGMGFEDAQIFKQLRFGRIGFFQRALILLETAVGKALNHGRRFDQRQCAINDEPETEMHGGNRQRK